MKVGGRVVEGQVAVFADAHAGDVDGGCGQEPGIALAFGYWVRRVAGEQVDGGEG